MRWIKRHPFFATYFLIFLAAAFLLPAQFAYLMGSIYMTGLGEKNPPTSDKIIGALILIPAGIFYLGIVIFALYAFFRALVAQDISRLQKLILCIVAILGSIILVGVERLFFGSSF